MVKRLTCLVLVSLGLHGLALLTWLWFVGQGLDAFRARDDIASVRLSQAGGTVWLNLHAGGQGTGGQGGFGLSVDSQPPASPKVEPVVPVKALPADRKGRTQPKQTKKPRHIQTSAASLRPAVPALPLNSPPLPLSQKPIRPDAGATPASQSDSPPQGGGEGDGQGLQSGLGGGEGSGLGQGRGAGVGSGNGPGGKGARGSGGEGKGGDMAAALVKIRSKIMRAKRYPQAARNAGQEGVASLRFEIGSDGLLRYVQVTKSSGVELLDSEALATVRRAAPFPYYQGPIELSLRFSLEKKP